MNYTGFSGVIRERSRVVLGHSVIGYIGGWALLYTLPCNIIGIGEQIDGALQNAPECVVVGPHRWARRADTHAFSRII